MAKVNVKIELDSDEFELGTYDSKKDNERKYQLTFQTGASEERVEIDPEQYKEFESLVGQDVIMTATMKIASNQYGTKISFKNVHLQSAKIVAKKAS